MNVISILKNKILIYLVSRYLVYGIQFLTSIIVAAKLGAYYMGVWGFVLLLINYFSQFHLGIANALNVLLVQHKDNKCKYNEYVWNSLFATLLLILFVALFYIYTEFVGIDDIVKFHANKYVLPVCLIAMLQYYNGIFTNIFRVENKLNSISFCQSILVILPFVCVFFFKGKILVDILVSCYLLGTMISFIYAICSKIIPIPNLSIFKKEMLKEILKKGVYLFLYNSCFAFIVISIRTIVSSNYSVNDFGKFTFAFTLGNAVMMLMDAFSFIAFPKVLSVLGDKKKSEVEYSLKYYSEIYTTCAHLVMYVFLLMMPALLYFMPQYSDSVPAFNIIGLALLMNAHNFLMSSFLIAKNMEKVSAKISMQGLILNVVIAIFLVKGLYVAYNLVVLATLITYFFMTILTFNQCRKEIRISLRDVFPIRMVIPYIVALILSIYSVSDFLWIPFILFVVLNFKRIVKLKDLTLRLINDSNLINI